MSHPSGSEAVGFGRRPTGVRMPIGKPLSGTQILGWTQVAAVTAVVGDLLIAIPATTYGIVRPEGAVALWFLVMLASLLAVCVGAMAKATDRLFGQPLKGGSRWNRNTGSHKTALVATTQIMLALAILEIALTALGSLR